MTAKPDANTRTIPKFKVCNDCGSTEIEIQAWVDVNTNEYHSDVDDDIWCSRCEDNVETCSKQSFLEKMQDGGNPTAPITLNT